MLHQRLDPIVHRDDRVLVTTATQCETRALATWLAETPESKRPWVLALFHSDRWNRYGPEERERQLSEFRVAASELARLDVDARRRLIVGATTDQLCQEIGVLLGTVVHCVPLILPSDGYIPPIEKPTGAPALVGVLGGARCEKGSYLIPAIITESRKLGPIDFAVQLVNEDLPAALFADLCRIESEPGIQVAHGPLDQATYRSLLARCDIVLLPYDRLPYKKRAGGIFVEAMLTGRPVVLPNGIWMSNRVTAGAAAGVVYDGNDPAAIAEALMRAVDDLPSLAALAKRHAAAWHETMTLDVFLDWLQEEIGRRGTSASGDARVTRSMQ
jgi:glycosyltransferase involved in cell wall biosynthesis